METRMRRYAPQASPERTKVWTEPPQKHHHHTQERHQGGRIPVVYYLYRNFHLEHPHFIEVPISSPEGLYLRDVIERLNVLRGKKMAALYSWSCKRSYKNGFVWHDLSEDDLILPAQGNEYVLKGSELVDQTPPDRNNHVNLKQPPHGNLKQPPQDPSPSNYKGQEGSCSPSSVGFAIKETKLPPPSPKHPSPPTSMQEAELFLSTHRLGSFGNFSPEPGGRSAPPSVAGSPNPAEYKICKPLVGSQDASTQTEAGEVQRTRKVRNAGASISDSSPLNGRNESQNEQALRLKREPEIVIAGRSSATTISSDTSSGRMNTLESLMQDEVNRRDNLSVLEGEEVFHTSGSKFKATSMLMHLITCGSTTVKNHYGFGFAPIYRPRFTDINFTSPLSANSLAMGEINCLAESQRKIGKGLKQNESFGRSIIETKYKEEISRHPSIKQSSSIGENRIFNMAYSTRDSKKEADSSLPKFLPKTIKLATSKHSRNDQNESTAMPVSDTRTSFATPDMCKSSPLSSSNEGSKRIIGSSSVNGTSARLDTFENRIPSQEKMIKIEERLTSGARVIIQSGSRSDDSEGGSD